MYSGQEVLMYDRRADIGWWQYSPRFFILQVDPPYLRYLWFALLSPKIENVRIELPSCAQNVTYDELLENLASGIISVCTCCNNCN